ncbi:sodium:solute symporter [Paucibacter sp. KBW04]|uniref:sodium:solute symporter n=1 Tax=Paucibacter sp. KBW04 TaxID=2153361 RepID=UPI000F58047F|nr:sodium:solute symporter [Paucibacter sp. KBW04]RQO59958.1 sodium:solute symporter [Paucibacter sp. KBW04]
MSHQLLPLFILAYFGLLLMLALWRSKGANSESFFIGNRDSHWLLVAFGMIGTSLSGVTFISVPGAVGLTGFSYLQIVIGQFFGYVLIALVLLPLYYRLRLSSIYDYLGQRLGPRSYRTGAGFFIVSRTLGATARLYLVVLVLQDAALADLGLPFGVSTAIILLMILLYTYKGGVKTIVWTDTLQTAGMLAGLLICAAFLLHALDLNMPQAWAAMRAQGLAEVVVSDPNSASFWLKQVLAGATIAVAMTGLDQEMMQKNISVKTLAGAQKNMLLLATVMVAVVALFLFLGGLLYLFAGQVGLAARGDQIFTAVVMHYLPAWVQIVFVLALISALFPSADGAITALTSSFCIDLLGMQKRSDWDEARRVKIRQRVHLGFAALFLAMVMLFHWIANPSMIGLILKLAAYTYGPLLGMFAFGILSRRQARDPATPFIALASPALCWLLESQQAHWLGEYRLGLELLLLNGGLCFLGLLLCSKPAQGERPASASTAQVPN